MAIQSGLSSLATVECQGCCSIVSEINEVQKGSGRGVNGVVEFAAFPVGQPGSFDKRRRAFEILLENIGALMPRGQRWRIAGRFLRKGMR